MRFGGTPNLTALQPIVIVEGVHETRARNVVPDRKLYRALSAGFDRLTVLPGGGASECLKLRDSLVPALEQFTKRLHVAVLLDRDAADERPMTDGKGTYYLPVSMIENFLLDPDAIWEAIQSAVEKTSLSSVKAVAEALDAVIDEIVDEESERRVLERLGADTFRPTRPCSAISQQMAAFVQQLGEKYDPVRVTSLKSETDAVVARIKAERKRREFFHGKDVLSGLYKRYLHKTGLAREVFIFETARHARRRKSVTAFFKNLFAELLPGAEPMKP